MIKWRVNFQGGNINFHPKGTLLKAKGDATQRISGTDYPVGKPMAAQLYQL